MADRLRVGVVGLGFGARVLVPALSASARCEIVGVCSRSFERARQVADAHGIPTAHRDWQALVEDPRVDAVVVATPPALHGAIAIAALSMRKPVFCEKPLAASLDAAGSMAASAVGAGVANMIDFEFPDMPAWYEARRILASGTLGRLRHVRVSWFGETYANRHGLNTWKNAVNEGGGALNEFVSHCFYYLEWLLGPVQQVWAAPSSQYERERGADTIAVVGLELQGGLFASISVNTAAFPGDGHSISIHAEEGTLLLSNPHTDVTGRFHLSIANRETSRFEPVAVDEPAVDDADYRIPATGRLLYRFVDWVTNGRTARPNFDDGLRVQTLLDAAWRSRLKGADFRVLVSGGAVVR